MYLLVIKQLCIMTVIVLAGFIFSKLFKIGENEQKFLSKLLLYFINPCLIISSFNRDFDLQKLKEFGFVVFISLFVYGAMILVAILTTPLKKKDRTVEEIEKQRSYNMLDRLAIVFTNCGFIGIPLINGVFGPDGVFYLLGFLIIFNVLLWTWGYYQMSGSINVKKIFTNPNILAVIIGLALFCLPVKLPEFIGKPIAMIGELNTATAMILIGVLFANFKFDSSQLFRLIRCILVRLVLCSVVTLAILFVANKLFGYLDNSRMMIFVIYICSLCPSATSVPSLSVLFEKDTSYASLLVSISSIASMVTIPLFVALGELVIKG